MLKSTVYSIAYNVSLSSIVMIHVVFYSGLDDLYTDAESQLVVENCFSLLINICRDLFGVNTLTRFVDLHNITQIALLVR